MSLDHTTGAPDGEHLDEEATSAALEEDASPDQRAHLDRCATCQASVERLRAVQAAVAAPVGLDADARESALATALRAFDHDVDARAEGARARRVSAISTLPTRAGRGERRRQPGAWLGAAAVLLLVALAVPLLRAAGSGGTSDDAGTEAAGGATVEEGGESGASTSATPPPVDVGDLGDIEVGEDLRPVVDAALGAGPGEATASDDDAGAGSDGGGESEEGAAGDAAGSDEGGESAEAAEPAPATSAPDRAAELEGAAPRGGPAEDAFAAARASCEPAVRAALPEAGALVLVGSGTVDGAPALVFGFAAPGGRPAVLTALVRAEGCELVTFQSYVQG